MLRDWDRSWDDWYPVPAAFCVAAAWLALAGLAQLCAGLCDANGVCFGGGL